MCCLSYSSKLSSSYLLANIFIKLISVFFIIHFIWKMPLFLPSPLCVLHIWQMSDGLATWAKPGVEEDASSPLWKLHTQEWRENSCSSFCVAQCMLSWIWAPEIYPESPNPVHMWRLMWLRQQSDLSPGQRMGILCLFPDVGSALKSLKHPFLQLSYSALETWVLHALSLRSSRGYCGLEQCQGQSVTPGKCHWQSCPGCQYVTATPSWPG